MERQYSNYIECSEAIASYLMCNVPAPWRSIEALVEIDHEDEMVTSELIYYPDQTGAKDWFAIHDGEEDAEFAACFRQLARLVSTPERGLFSKCKFTLQPDGRYRTEYEY